MNNNEIEKKNIENNGNKIIDLFNFIPFNPNLTNNSNINLKQYPFKSIDNTEITIQNLKKN